MKRFSFSSFQFPACNACNEKYSSLETETKPIIEKVLKRDFVINLEINTLLNRFDKVRIGLWLGGLVLDNGYFPVNPKLHIDSRIAEKDRSQFVYEMDDNLKGIQFTGVNALAFLFSPNCFFLCINNFHFFNISNDFLIQYKS